MTDPSSRAGTAAPSTTIQPSAYPVLPAAIAIHLRSPETAKAAETVLEAGAADIRAAVLVHVDRLQSHIAHMQAAVAKGAFETIYHEAHEVRGLAGNAGLNAAARIASELCRYLDAMACAERQPDAAVVQLHLEATVRAACAEDEATRLGGSVAQGLATLVDRKLADINALETNPDAAGI